MSVAANLTRTEASRRTELLTVSDYAVDLDLSSSVGEGVERFRSRTTVRFSSREVGAQTFIDLVAPVVQRVRLNGRDLAPADMVGGDRVRLPDLAAENVLEVVAECAYMRTGEGLHRFTDPVDGEVYLHSQFEVADARRVFCCFDQPDLKATFTFSVTAPAHWQVFSVSSTPEPVPAGTGIARWEFETTPRLSTYVTSVVAGPYRGVSSRLLSRDGRTVPLGVHCRASMAEHLDAEHVLDVTRAGFGHYEELFDLAYPFTKYDQIFVPEFNAGAMENAGCVTITDEYLFRSKPTAAVVERRALTVLHELAHMWFGDLVTMRWWDDLWLNESFAEYASIRCQAEATTWRTAWTTFLSAEKAWAYRQDQLSSTHPIVAEIRDLADVEVNFDGITYAKGAAVLKQLVHWVGQDAFDEGVRRYFRRHAWGNTTLTDLLGELAATSGQDVAGWAASWLERAGVNTVRPLMQTDEAGRITTAAVLQEAPVEHPVLRPHRLGVAGYDLVADGTGGRVLRRSWSTEVDVAGERTDLPELAGRARPDLLLLNDADLTYTKLRLDERSLATATAHLDAFEDPLPATLVWGATWDMTRDGELAARVFVDQILRHITSVTDPSVQQTLLHQLSATLTFYLAPAHAVTTRDAAVQTLLEELHEAAPGSDTQLLLTRSLAALARRKDHLDTVAELLDGSRPLPGLDVDTDLRWTLLTALVAGGRAGEDRIAAELTRDDTAAGRERAAAARAAVPTPQAKQAAWDSVINDGDLPNATHLAVIRGFGRVNDVSLLEPFVQPYFDQLQRIWSTRTTELATQVAEGMFPARLVRGDVVDRAEEWLATSGAEPALSRLVAEGRDALARALRVQQRDAAG